MSLEVNVIPGVLAALKLVQGGPTPGNPTPVGKLRSIHLGDQWSVAGRGPVAWVLNSDGSEDEPGGSDTEKTNHVIEVRLLFPFAADQRHAEDVLMALLEPIRQVFRAHRKLKFTAVEVPSAGLNLAYTGITRARVASWRWFYLVVGKQMYRVLSLSVLVGEKIGQTYSAGG